MFHGGGVQSEQKGDADFETACHLVGGIVEVDAELIKNVGTAATAETLGRRHNGAKFRR